MRRTFSFICILVLMITLCACEKKQEITGVWRTYDIGVHIDSPEIPEYLTFVFNSDGTGSGPVGDFARLDYPTFTYKVEDGIIYAHTDDDIGIEMKYTLDDDTMTLEYSGYERTLHRVSE